MFDTKGLLLALRSRGVSNAEIARAVGLPDSRIAEIFGGRRQVKLDEAKRLVDAFSLEEPVSAAEPISDDVARLLVLHIAARAGASLDPADALVQELAADLTAFARFARRLDHAPTPETARGFLAGRMSGPLSRH